MLVTSMHLKNHGPTMNDMTLDGFKPVTVVYGRNGVGKTLISDVFRSIEKNGKLEPGVANLSLAQAASNSVPSRELVIDPYPSADLSKHVRVFNKRFVSDNVVPDNTNPASIVLGSDNQELKDRIEAASRDVRKLAKEADAQESEKAAAAQKLRQAQRSVAERVRDVTAGARGLARNQDASKGMFNLQHVAKLDDQWDRNGEVALARRSESNLASLDRTLTDSKEPINRPNLQPPQVDEIRQSATAILSKVPQGNPLPDAEADRDRRDWLRTGLDYVDADDGCGFCKCRVPARRLNDLKMAFAGNYDALKGELKRLTVRIAEINDSFADLPDMRDIVPSLQDRYRAVVDRYNQVADAVRTDLEAIKTAVKAKIENLSKSPILPSRKYQTEEWLELDQDLCRLFDEHDATIGDLVKVRDEFVAGRFAEGYEDRKQIREDIARIEESLALTRESIRAKNEELDHLRNLASTRRQAAQQLTAEVQEFLGYREFAFELSDDDESSFVITRSGKKARGLSEGETSALGLLYFLKQLEDPEFDSKNGVVVIDDPVTSFDDVNLHRAYAAIISKTTSVGTEGRARPQVVLLTHHVRLMQRMYRALKHKGRNGVAFKHLKTAATSGNRSATWDTFKYGDAFRDPYQRSFDEVLRIAEGEEPSNSPERPIRVCLESFVEQIAPKAAAKGLGQAVATICEELPEVIGSDSINEQDLLELMDFAHAEEHPGPVTDAEARERDLRRTANTVLKIMRIAAPTQLLDMKRD